MTKEDFGKAISLCQQRFDEKTIKPLLDLESSLDFSKMLSFLYNGKRVAHTREKSTRALHQAIIEDKLVINNINVFLSRYFFQKLFKIVLDRKWASKFVPLLKYSSLNKTDYEVLVWVCGAAITVLSHPSRRLSKNVRAIIGSMRCDDKANDVTKYSGMVKDHNRGGLKFVTKNACELMGALELIFSKAEFHHCY